MRVKFAGIIEVKTGGCSVCGKRRSRSQLSTTKTFYLSSGSRLTFRAGRPVDVSEEDGNELLSYTYIDPQGHERKMFERV